MDCHEAVKSKIEDLLKNIAKYTFPEILFLLRNNCLGCSRQRVCEDTGLKQNRLFYLENGKFQRDVYSHEVKKLSEYYGIDQDILFGKLKDYETKRRLRRLDRI